MLDSIAWFIFRNASAVCSNGQNHLINNQWFFIWWWLLMPSCKFALQQYPYAWMSAYVCLPVNVKSIRAWVVQFGSYNMHCKLAHNTVLLVERLSSKEAMKNSRRQKKKKNPCVFHRSYVLFTAIEWQKNSCFCARHASERIIQSTNTWGHRFTFFSFFCWWLVRFMSATCKSAHRTSCFSAYLRLLYCSLTILSNRGI